MKTPPTPDLIAFYTKVKEMRMKCNMKWNAIQWKRAHSRVWKLQRKIYENSRLGNKTRVRLYQEKLINSDSAKLIAVRKVTQDNRGKKTPWCRWR